MIVGIRILRGIIKDVYTLLDIAGDLTKDEYRAVRMYCVDGMSATEIAIRSYPDKSDMPPAYPRKISRTLHSARRKLLRRALKFTMERSGYRDRAKKILTRKEYAVAYAIYVDKLPVGVFVKMAGVPKGEVVAILESAAAKCITENIWRKSP